eukprot:5705458-Prymnesium_polylepis.1
MRAYHAAAPDLHVAMLSGSSRTGCTHTGSPRTVESSTSHELAEASQVDRVRIARAEQHTRHDVAASDKGRGNQPNRCRRTAEPGDHSKREHDDVDAQSDRGLAEVVASPLGATGTFNGNLDNAASQKASQVAGVRDDRHSIGEQHRCHCKRKDGLDQHHPTEARRHNDGPMVAKYDAGCTLARTLGGAKDGRGDGGSKQDLEQISFWDVHGAHEACCAEQGDAIQPQMNQPSVHKICAQEPETAARFPERPHQARSSDKVMIRRVDGQEHIRHEPPGI